MNIPPYKINVNEHSSFLETCVTGELTANVLTAFLADAAKKSLQQRINNFLFDLRNTSNKTDLFTHYKLAAHESRDLGFELGSKHALLASEDNLKDYMIVETFLENHGYIAKIFTDRDKAVEWLK